MEFFVNLIIFSCIFSYCFLLIWTLMSKTKKKILIFVYKTTKNRRTKIEFYFVRKYNHLQ